AAGCDLYGPFEIAAGPMETDGCAAAGRDPIFKRKSRPGTFQKRLGDEKTEPEARRLVATIVRMSAAAGDVRFPDPTHNFRREAGTIVADGDLDRILGPVRLHRNTVMSKIYCIFQKIAEAIQNCRVAGADRFGAKIVRRVHFDGHAEIAVWRYHFFDQRGESHAVEGFAAAAGRQLGEFRQNITTSRGLFAQEPDVVSMRRVRR